MESTTGCWASTRVIGSEDDEAVETLGGKIEKTPEWNSNVQSVERLDIISKTILYRGWVNVGAGKFTPNASDPPQCVIEFILSVDLRDKLTPKAVLSTGIADTMISDAKNAYTHVENEKSAKQKES
uniref:START domain-containing protein n=1 Tax=Angiostrongylus cantonensis TaxID=6313 RepID=A0A0K0D9V4_ANGCA